MHCILEITNQPIIMNAMSDIMVTVATEEIETQTQIAHNFDSREPISSLRTLQALRA